MATTSNTYTGNGSNKLFSITFPYLDTSDIDVYLNGILQTITTQYFFANATTVEFVAAPSNGAVVLLNRSTDDGTLQATFFPGSSIKAADLNDNFDQVLYLSQETNNNVANAVAGQIPDGSITSAKIADNSITSAKIVNDSIINEDVNASAGIVASKLSFTQSGTGATARTVDSKLKDVVSVKDFGAVGDGVADDTAAIQAALNSGAKTVIANAGTYKATASLSVPATVSLIGEGRNATVLTAEGNTTGTFSTGSVLSKVGTAPTQIAELGATATKSTRTLTFATAHGLAVGDVILIYNPTDGSFNDARTSYRSGEFCTVSEVTSTTVVGLESALYDTYLAANVDVYKCAAFSSGKLQGFTVVAPGPGANGVINAIDVTYGHKIELEDIGARNSDNASMSISRSYKITGRSLDCYQWSQNPGFNTQYGLVIGNSQELDMSGSFTGYRHGIAYGGGNTFSIPCRAGIIHDFVAKNRSGDIASADWHGNCEWCVYENGTLYGGGLNIAGNNNRITGIKAIGDNLMLILGREILGCNHVVENVECYTRRDDSTRGIINIGGNEIPMDATITRFGGQFIFRNIHVDAPLHTGCGVLLRNRGFAGDPFDLIVDNFTFIAPSNNSASLAAVRLATVSGNACARAQATNITTLSTTATPPITLAATDATCLVRQGAKTGSLTATTTTGVSLIDTAVTFDKVFAKVPSVVVNNQLDTTGSDRVFVFARTPATTGFTARLRRMDDATANFSGALAIGCQWTASLNEW
jgi:hypothetical protein